MLAQSNITIHLSKNNKKKQALNSYIYVISFLNDDHSLTSIEQMHHITKSRPPDHTNLNNANVIYCIDIFFNIQQHLVEVREEKRLEVVQHFDMLYRLFEALSIQQASQPHLCYLHI